MSMAAYANTLGKDGLVKADNSLAKAVDPSSAVKKVPLEEKVRALASILPPANKQSPILHGIDRFFSSPLHRTWHQ